MTAAVALSRGFYQVMFPELTFTGTRQVSGYLQKKKKKNRWNKKDEMKRDGKGCINMYVRVCVGVWLLHFLHVYKNKIKLQLDTKQHTGDTGDPNKILTKIKNNKGSCYDYLLLEHEVDQHLFIN